MTTSVDWLRKTRGFLSLPRNAWVLTSTSSLWSIGSAMASPYQTLYFAALGASDIDIGILVAFGTAVTILALLVGGYVADTWGRRRVIVTFSWISVCSAVIYAVINSAYLIIVPLTIASLAQHLHPGVQLCDGRFHRACRPHTRFLGLQRDKQRALNHRPDSRRTAYGSLRHLGRRQTGLLREPRCSGRSESPSGQGCWARPSPQGRTRRSLS